MFEDKDDALKKAGKDENLKNAEFNNLKFRYNHQK